MPVCNKSTSRSRLAATSFHASSGRLSTRQSHERWWRWDMEDHNTRRPATFVTGLSGTAHASAGLASRSMLPIMVHVPHPNRLTQNVATQRGVSPVTRTRHHSARRRRSRFSMHWQRKRYLSGKPRLMPRSPLFRPRLLRLGIGGSHKARGLVCRFWRKRRGFSVQSWAWRTYIPTITRFGMPPGAYTYRCVSPFNGMTPFAAETMGSHYSTHLVVQRSRCTSILVDTRRYQRQNQHPGISFSSDTCYSKPIVVASAEQAHASRPGACRFFRHDCPAGP